MILGTALMLTAGASGVGALVTHQRAFKTVAVVALGSAFAIAFAPLVLLLAGMLLERIRDGTQGFSRRGQRSSRS
jgi:hypothetical protein